MSLELKDLVIGGKYRVKDSKWFEENIENEWNRNAYSQHHGTEMILNEIVNGSTLVLYAGWKYTDGHAWIPLEGVEEIVGQPKPSKEILKTIKKLKKENYIYGYDGGPGGGGGCTINTVKENILPVFTRNGEQKIFMAVRGLRRDFTVEKINELFKEGKCEQGFQATEYSYIRTELKIIKDKSNLPKCSSWSTMRD